MKTSVTATTATDEGAVEGADIEAKRKAEWERWEAVGRYGLAGCEAEWRGEVFTVFLCETGEVVYEEARIRWEKVTLEYLAWAWNLLCANGRVTF